MNDYVPEWKLKNAVFSRISSQAATNIFATPAEQIPDIENPKVYDDAPTDAEDFAVEEAMLFGDDDSGAAPKAGEKASGPADKAAQPEELLNVPDILVEGQD